MPGSPLGTPDNPLRVAVIGSGPSGFYATERLLNAEDLSVQVDVYDRLPTPFGLVRGGVAPDHQKIKSVTRVFDKIAAHPEFRFFGNVEVGRDIVRDEMLAYYHGIIYAVGARTDRRMWIPREHLPGSHSATEFVGWYNAHPDYRRMRFNLQADERGGRRQRQRGDGRGAPPGEPARAPGGHRHLGPRAGRAWSRARCATSTSSVDAGPAQAAFTNKEIKELGELPGVDVIVDPGAMELDQASQAYVDASDDKSLERNLAILRGYAEREPTGAPTRIYLHFLVSPVEIVGDDSVTRWSSATTSSTSARTAACAPPHRPAHDDSTSGWSSARSATRASRCPGCPSTTAVGWSRTSPGGSSTPPPRRRSSAST